MPAPVLEEVANIAAVQSVRQLCGISRQVSNHPQQHAPIAVHRNHPVGNFPQEAPAHLGNLQWRFNFVDRLY